MESVNSQFRTYTQNVKRWTNGTQVLRWMAAASLFVEDQLRRIPGYCEIPQLRTPLKSDAELRIFSG